MSYSSGKTADPTVNLKGAGGEADGAGWDCACFLPTSALSSGCPFWPLALLVC